MRVDKDALTVTFNIIIIKASILLKNACFYGIILQMAINMPTPEKSLKELEKEKKQLKNIEKKKLEGIK
ncbi:MAG: hypothetical protein IJ890_06150 [Clostridia bacterium]|nr:hypothetical protein [Clostridia bacterium]